MTTTRYFKIYENTIAYYFTTPEELQAFIKKTSARKFTFYVVDVQKISETSSKETEILCLNHTNI